MPAVQGNFSNMESAIEFMKENAGLVALAVVIIVTIQVLLTSGILSGGSKPFLDPQNFQDVKLASKISINHNTVLLRFEFGEGKKLGLPIGQHISFKAAGDDGKDVYRSYTPTSDDDLLGAVEFVIKLYPQGKMSQIISKLEPGQTMAMKGPKGRLQYYPNMKRHIGMLAGGSGVTPMFQVLNAILKNKSDKTQVSLVFGNVTEEDILLREQLDALAAAHPDRLHLHYLLNSPPANWKGGVGFVTADVVKEHMPAPADDVMVLHCGPPPMVEAVKKVLADVGYNADAQFGF